MYKLVCVDSVIGCIAFNSKSNINITY